MSTPADQPGTLRVSIVIVTRNRAEIIPDCLDSLVTQDQLPDEVIIVRGDERSCSKELADRYPQLRIIITDCPDPNISMARNIGTDRASGDMVIFIDDDAIAHQGLLQAYTIAFQSHPDAWAAGGTVLDARKEPPEAEFDQGLIHPTGKQIVVRTDPSQSRKRGYLDAVKGCNFALHLGRLPADLRFDPFFRFAFDEADLILQVHARGGAVIHVPRAIVDHSHAPGEYRATGPLDRDWATEFASHTRFMRKHTRGFERFTGWLIVIRRLIVHSLRAAWALAQGQITTAHAMRCIRDAFSGINRGSSLRDSD